MKNIHKKIEINFDIGYGALAISFDAGLYLSNSILLYGRARNDDGLCDWLLYYGRKPAYYVSHQWMRKYVTPYLTDEVFAWATKLMLTMPHITMHQRNAYKWIIREREKYDSRTL